MMPDYVAYYLTQDLNPPLSPTVIWSEAESRLVEPWRESLRVAQNSSYVWVQNLQRLLDNGIRKGIASSKTYYASAHQKRHFNWQKCHEWRPRAAILNSILSVQRFFITSWMTGGQLCRMGAVEKTAVGAKIIHLSIQDLLVDFSSFFCSGLPSVKLISKRAHGNTDRYRRRRVTSLTHSWCK